MTIDIDKIKIELKKTNRRGATRMRMPYDTVGTFILSRYRTVSLVRHCVVLRLMLQHHKRDYSLPSGQKPPGTHF